MAAIAISMMTAIISCKKDTQAPDQDAPPAAIPTAVGLWTGKYGNGASLGVNYAQLMRANGTMRAYVGGNGDTASATSKAEGTWTINGLVIKTTYKLNASQTHTTEGIADQNFSSIEGSWKSNLVIGAGGFKMTKEK